MNINTKDVSQTLEHQIIDRLSSVIFFESKTKLVIFLCQRVYC
jgi:hypothetical protein